MADDPFELFPVDVLPCVSSRSGYGLAGDFCKLIAPRAGGRGNYAVQRLVVGQLRAERPDVLARLVFDSELSCFAVYGQRRDDLLEVADILGHLQAGTVGPLAAEELPGAPVAASNVIPLAHAQPMPATDAPGGDEPLPFAV